MTERREQPLTAPRTSHVSRMTKAGLMLSILFALLTLPRTARAENEAPMSERQFIELMGKPAEGDGAPREPGRPMARAGEPAAAKKEEDAGEGKDGDEGDGTGEGGDEGDDTGLEGEDGEGGDDEGDNDAGKGANKKDGDEAGDEGDEDDGDGEDADGPTADEDAAFKKALAEEGVEVKLEDIPEEARPIVQRKLKDLERGFHAKMRELAEDRKAARAFKAEERFRSEHPADYIVSLLMEKDGLSEAVNERIEQMQDNRTALEGHRAIVEEGRRKAADAEAKADNQAESDAKSHAQRVDNYERWGRAAARAAGVPFEAGVEEAIAARLAIGEELTQDDIRGIAKQKATIFKRSIRERNRGRSDEYVKGKVADRKKAGLRVKPGAGRAPSPAAKKVASSDQEFIDEFASRTG